ncbi:MAG TPA: hypothetical protein VFT65_13615 [Candidatus Angelobacter sp.]|nr:hypothetical protein [Candidatus Angelobacter sp.]
MPETNGRQSNRAPWAAFFLALAAMLSNVAFFVAFPGQRFVPWIGVGLVVASLLWVALGIKRAFLQPQLFGGKKSSSILGVLALAICAFTMFAFIHARELPASAGAPQVGQKAPDFTLADTSGNSVSLAQLLGQAGSPAPRAVLLIFYRGDW